MKHPQSKAERMYINAKKDRKKKDKRKEETSEEILEDR